MKGRRIKFYRHLGSFALETESNKRRKRSKGNFQKINSRVNRANRGSIMLSNKGKVESLSRLGLG